MTIEQSTEAVVYCIPVHRRPGTALVVDVCAEFDGLAFEVVVGVLGPFIKVGFGAERTEPAEGAQVGELVATVEGEIQGAACGGTGAEGLHSAVGLIFLGEHEAELAYGALGINDRKVIMTCLKTAFDYHLGGIAGHGYGRIGIDNGCARDA